jgi:hypothetical protein
MSKTRELIGPGATVEIHGAESRDVTYTHSVFGTFNITRLLRHVASRDTIGIGIQNLPQFEDLDEHRIVELCQPGNLDLHEPVLLIDCEDGTHIMVDGSHRTTAKRRLGYEGTQARVATLTEARQFQVTVRVTRADGSTVDPLEIDRAWLEDDRGRHNAADGTPRPGSANPDLILPPRRTP